MTLPEAGWYTDPHDVQQNRWWTGVGWSEHQQTRAQQAAPVFVPAPPEAIDEYVPMARRAPAQSTPLPLTRTEKDRQVRKHNSMAYTGLVLSILSLLVNPFAILSILGIVFSSIGLAKSHELEGGSVTGRGTAIGGLVVGLVGLVAFVYLALN